MPVKYTGVIPEYGDLLTVQEFKDNCERGYLIDYDGVGAISDGVSIDNFSRVYPSTRDSIPVDATHIVWFNK
jgi:hypothetical protein